ncbi:hypothetical protein JE959_001627 [Aeromonas veronii]|nr:hypothetical protein [Aeromonas veronii]
MANGEWELLTEIVKANNNRDYAAIYRILADDSLDFSDKPRCVHAAMNAIELLPENVSRHKDVLSAFVKRIDAVQVDYVTAFRFELLKDLLADAERRSLNNDVHSQE